MSDALARLQASAAQQNLTPQRTVETCLAQGVVKRVQALSEELAALQMAAFRTTDPDDTDAPPDEQAKPVRKMAQGHDPRIEEIQAELGSLEEIMREHTGHVTVAKTISNGEWRLWADANPPREEEGRDEKGRALISRYDLSVAGGFCNGTALLERLGDFVTEWNGEPLSEGQWEWLRERMPLGDQKEVARWVVSFYEAEGAKAAPKSLSVSPTTPETSPSSSSPEPSASPADGSSGGNPPSATTTSTPTGT